ncbi:MAG: fatty acid desaturase family protein [Myxococcota bacterium]
MPSAAITAKAETRGPATRIQGREGADPAEGSSRERYASFQKAIDDIRARAEAELGPEDVDYMRRVQAFSKAMEAGGRLLIHFSPEPLSFCTGVGALWIHKQLEATEIGHTVLHGTYDRMKDADTLNSKTFVWDTPIDETCWRHGHNVRHHQYTNVAGKDPDIHFGHVRLTEQTPHTFHNYHQLPFALTLIWPNFLFVMNAHFTGLIDVYFGNGREDDLDFLPDRSMASLWNAHRRAFRKYIPYYAKEYIFYPMLAGPAFPKVLFGNFLAETIRNVYSAATIFCGHVGGDVQSFDEGTKARGRGQWYAMQVEASNDFSVSWPLSVLCGGLDLQIEHHLFPKLPPNRLREVAPQVEAACRAHGIPYRKESWPKTLGKALAHIGRLSMPRAKQCRAKGHSPETAVAGAV